MGQESIESKARELLRRTAFYAISFNVGGMWEGSHMVTGERVYMRVRSVAWYSRLAFWAAVYGRFPFGRRLILWARRGVQLEVDRAVLEA